MNVRKGNSIKYVRLRLDKEGRQLYVQSQLGAKPQYLTLPNIFIQFSPLADSPGCRVKCKRRVPSPFCTFPVV